MDDEAYEARLDWIDTRARAIAVEYAQEFNRFGTIERELHYADYMHYKEPGQTPREYFMETFQHGDETAEQIIARLALEAAVREFDSEET